MIVTRYQSMEHFAGEFTRVMMDPKSVFPNSDRFHGRSWNGGLEWQDSAKCARVGNEALAESANGLLNDLDLQLPSTSAFQTLRSPFGGRVNMADWMSGSPTPMRRRVKRVSDVAPIKVIVCLTSSAGIDSSDLEKRGAAILAFVLRAQTIRPVELELLVELGIQGPSLYSPTDSHYQIIPVQSKPLALGQAAFGLCHTATSRQMGYAMGDQVGFQGGWPAGFTYDKRNNTYAKLRRERLALTETDIVIREAYLDDELITQPVKWITEQLNKLMNTEEKD